MSIDSPRVCLKNQSSTLDAKFLVQSRTSNIGRMSLSLLLKLRTIGFSSIASWLLFVATCDGEEDANLHMLSSNPSQRRAIFGKKDPTRRLLFASLDAKKKLQRIEES